MKNKLIEAIREAAYYVRSLSEIDGRPHDFRTDDGHIMIVDFNIRRWTDETDEEFLKQFAFICMLLSGITMYKFVKEDGLEMDLIHHFKLENDISINDLLGYIIKTMKNYGTKEYVQEFVLNGEQYSVSIKERKNEK